MSQPGPMSRERLVLVAMTLANAMILVDQTAVPLALPDIMDTFGIGSASAQWVLNARLRPLARLLVLGGRPADLLGRRRVFLIGSALFAGASAVAGLAPLFVILLAARVVQGVGGALMLPSMVAILGGPVARKTVGGRWARWAGSPLSPALSVPPSAGFSRSRSAGAPCC